MTLHSQASKEETLKVQNQNLKRRSTITSEINVLGPQIQNNLVSTKKSMKKEKETSGENFFKIEELMKTGGQIMKKGKIIYSELFHIFN